MRISAMLSIMCSCILVKEGVCAIDKPQCAMQVPHTQMHPHWQSPDIHVLEIRTA